MARGWEDAGAAQVVDCARTDQHEDRPVPEVQAVGARADPHEHDGAHDEEELVVQVLGEGRPGQVEPVGEIAEERVRAGSDGTRDVARRTNRRVEQTR